MMPVVKLWRQLSRRRRGSPKTFGIDRANDDWKRKMKKIKISKEIRLSSASNNRHSLCGDFAGERSNLSCRSRNAATEYNKTK